MPPALLTSSAVGELLLLLLLPLPLLLLPLPLLPLPLPPLPPPLVRRHAAGLCCVAACRWLAAVQFTAM